MSATDQPYAGPPASEPRYGYPGTPLAGYGYGYPGGHGHPAPYGLPGGYGHPAPYGPPSPYGYPSYGPPPVDRRPGQVITAAVLSFTQAAFVALASLYLFFFASVAGFAAGGLRGRGTPTMVALAGEGRVLAVVGLLSAGFLVVPGVALLSRRSRGVRVLVILSCAMQVALTGYWLARLAALSSGIPGFAPGPLLFLGALCFLGGPLTTLVLVLAGPGRRWFDVPAPVETALPRH